MKSILLAAALLSLSSQSFAETKPMLKVFTHTALDAGFVVNSHLLVGNKEAVLVDAQFTRSEAKKVVEMILGTGKKLTKVFVTHGHPDHYFGFEVIQKAFPEAKLVSKAEVIADIKATAQGKLDYWKPIYKDDLTDKAIIPEELAANELTIDGVKVEIKALGEGESEHAYVLNIPSLRAVVAGDAIYNQVHLWLAEGHPQAWLTSLKVIEALQPKTIYPGHGKSGNAAALIKENRQYIENFVTQTQIAKTADDLSKTMQKLYPTYVLPVIADISSQAAKK